MADTEPAPIRGQDSAYRKGLVLGLTMAEIMLLILFMLLLVLGSIVAQREALIHQQKQKIADLEILDHFVSDELLNSGSQVTVNDIIRQIQRQKSENAALRQQVAQLRPFEQAGREIDDIIREIQRDGGHANRQSVIKALQERAASTKDNATLRGQVAELARQIKASGNGGHEFPSCWVTPDGKPVSLFVLTFYSAGVSVHDRHLPDRVEEETGLPLGGIRFDTPLPPATFNEQLRPLYQWSVDHNCRFYVIRYSVVSDVPVVAVNAAGALFYPELDDPIPTGRVMIELAETILALRCAMLAKIARQRGIHSDSSTVKQLASRMNDAEVLAELHRIQQRLSWWRIWGRHSR